MRWPSAKVETHCAIGTGKWPEPSGVRARGILRYEITPLRVVPARDLKIEWFKWVDTMDCSIMFIFLFLWSSKSIEAVDAHIHNNHGSMKLIDSFWIFLLILLHRFYVLMPTFKKLYMRKEKNSTESEGLPYFLYWVQAWVKAPLKFCLHAAVACLSKYFTF